VFEVQQEVTTAIASDQPTPPHAAHEVVLERVGIGNRGGRYAVTFRGEVICVSRDPEFAACRELARRGLTGMLTTRWKDSPHPAMKIDIARGAKRRTEETGRDGLYTVRWKPSATEPASDGEVDT
jgi:hypothetical protein